LSANGRIVPRVETMAATEKLVGTTCLVLASPRFERRSPPIKLAVGGP
jgi:hypothetical protein